MSILVLQSSWWGRESWLLCLVCLPGVSWWFCGSSSRCHEFFCCFWLWYFLIILTYYILGSEYTLYLLYMNHKTGDLETWFTSLESKWVWAGNAPDQVPYCFKIWSWNNFAITKSDCNYCLPFFVCRQSSNKYWNIWSETLVCRPGSNPLCGLGGGALVKNQLFTIWYMQQHGSKYSSRRHTLYPSIELHYGKFLSIKSEFCW